MSSDSGSALDGNAAAGDLRQVFAVDVTAATGKCAGCGQTATLGQAQLYAQAPGLVVRCGNCESVLLRLVSSPDRTWLDLRGLAYLQLSTPQAP
jgi:hypothetical protein